MINVDHELDSINAAGFRRANRMSERMKLRASGEIPEKEPEVTTPKVSESPKPKEPVSLTVSDENTVTIENKNITFEIAYPHDTKLIIVGMKAMSVDISDDSVSILMQDTVKLKLPKLEPLHLSVDGTSYKVCWAGGSHSFGKFKHISFVVIE